MTLYYQGCAQEYDIIRVLIVDNDLTDRKDLMEKVKDMQFLPIVAGGLEQDSQTSQGKISGGKPLIEDAIHKAREERCHAALVDIRLYDDHDIGDKSGLDLVPHLKPAKSIVITGYGTPSASRKANEHGAAMVGKEEGFEPVRLELERALQDVHRSDLTISPPGWLEKHIAPYLKSDSRQPVQADEVGDVLAMLFPQAKRIYLQNLQRTVSSTPMPTSGLRGSSVVVRAKPDNLATSVIKFAAPSRIMRERTNYAKYVEERSESRRHARMSTHKRFWNVGAIVYSFLGEDSSDISLFHTFYRTHTADEIATALRDFGHSVWYPLYAERSALPDSLFTAYDRLWARSGSDGYLAAKLADWGKLDKYRSFEGLNGQFPEPRRWLADHYTESLLPNTRQCIVHGDLHGGNLFVDKHGNTWIIDFERTGPGHILADFVELEHDILRQLAGHLVLSMFYGVIELTTSLAINSTPKDDSPFFTKMNRIFVQIGEKPLIAEVEKALRVIYELRKIVVEIFGYTDPQEYYWALLLDTLFAVQRLEKQEKFAPEEEVAKQKELLLASTLCERLKTGKWEWPSDDWGHSSRTFQSPEAGPDDSGVQTVQIEREDTAIKILFLAANPSNTVQLHLDREYRDIREALQKSGARAQFRLTSELAVRVNELIQLLLHHQPTVVHFSGHGSADGEIMLENESGHWISLPQEAVRNLFGILNRHQNAIKCVILNACFSERQALFIAEHVDIVIGISSEIGDVAATRFSAAFYTALGERKDVQTAYDLAGADIHLHKIGSEKALRLFHHPDIEPHDYYLP